MTDEFSSFVMSETTASQIKALPEESQLKYFWAAVNYGIYGIEPDFTGIELAVWVSMRDWILYTKRKDEKWHQKQRENGKKGGRPRKTQNNPNNPDKPKETQNNSGLGWVSAENGKSHNDNDNDNENDNENDNVNENHNQNLNQNGNENDSCGSSEPPDKKTSSKNKSGKQKKPPLREREPVNDMERVEKVYLQNWDMLYSKKRVQTPNPIVTWEQTRKLLKTLFEKKGLTPEQIIQAINNGLNDDWIVNEKGYSLGVMLTGSILNSLINGKNDTGATRSRTGPTPHRIAADNIPDDKLEEFFS